MGCVHPADVPHEVCGLLTFGVLERHESRIHELAGSKQMLWHPQTPHRIGPRDDPASQGGKNPRWKISLVTGFMKNMQLTQWMPLKLSNLKKNSWDFQVGPAYGDLQHWAASGTKGQQSAMVHHWHQWSWPQTEESSHHTGGTQWPKCEHLLLNREKNKRNQYPETETKSKDLGLFLGILKKTKQILDGYVSWQLWTF